MLIQVKSPEAQLRKLIVKGTKPTTEQLDELGVTRADYDSRLAWYQSRCEARQRLDKEPELRKRHRELTGKMADILHVVPTAVNPAMASMMVAPEHIKGVGQEYVAVFHELTNLQRDRQYLMQTPPDWHKQRMQELCEQSALLESERKRLVEIRDSRWSKAAYDDSRWKAVEEIQRQLRYNEKQRAKLESKKQRIGKLMLEPWAKPEK